MAKREKVDKPRSEFGRRATEVHEDSRTQRLRTRRDQNAQAILDELDAMLDEIDELLEENAEEFVDNFIQQGGE